MLSRTLLLALLIFLPGITLTTLAVRLRVRGTLKLGLILLAGAPIPGYCLFWIYLVSPKAGYVCSAALPFLLLVLLLSLLIQLTSAERGRLLPLLVPLGLTFFAALGVLSLGFLYGGKNKPLETAQTRFSHSLPPDNILPLLFAEDVRLGSVPKPMLGDWLSSDRPPLQTDMILALEPLIEGRPMDYEIASVILQSLWVFAIWLLLRAFRISPLSRGLVIITVYLTGFTLVNSFYTWPKLIAAAYMLAFAIPVLALKAGARRPSWWLRALSAFLLACGLLSHGGSLFVLIGLVLYTLTRWRRSILAEGCIVSFLAVVLYFPWMAYQKFVDPPGDRLVKWHLAGMEQPNNIPALTAIRQAYKNQNLSDWEWSKKANLSVVFGYERELFKQLRVGPGALRETRTFQFFYLVPAIGFIGCGAAGVFVWRKSRDAKAARPLLACFVLTATATILMLFEPGGATIQSTSYTMVLMAMAGVILAFRAALPRTAMAVCLAQCLWTWSVYAPDLRALTVPGFKPGGIIGAMLVLHIMALTGFAGVLFGHFPHAGTWDRSSR